MIKFAIPVSAGQQQIGGAEAAGILRGAKHPARALFLFLVVSFGSAALLLSLLFYTPAYTLSIGGNELGPVSSREMAETTLSQVEGQIGQILGYSYSMNLDLEYNFTIAAKDDLMGYTSLATALYDQSSAIKPAYILTVDGVEVGAAESMAVLDGALKDLQQQYSTSDTQSIFFANETRMTRKYIPAGEAYASRADVVTAARSPKADAEQKPQAVAAIARTYDMSEGSFLAQSAVYESAPSPLGSMVSVERSVPLLSVCTVDRVRYTEAIESPVREVLDPELYEGDTAIRTEGMPGLRMIEADVTSLNGERLYEESVSALVLLPATETVMAVGTKERPAFMGTGNFQWPCNGELTSLFGYRYIFGSTSFHAGLDIANSRGTAITASDNGFVTFADYKGSYGNMVIVDHGNGYETAYAHCESMNVSVGQGVLQGEQIGTMGTSGRATGNHCHFEVRINGEQVDPQLYLP